MLKVKIFNIASQRLWPILRHFKKKLISERCRLCINSQKYQPFEEGICRACHEYNRQKYLSESFNDKATHHLNLNKHIESFVGTGKKGLDALVFFSGGKDSTFLALNLKQYFPKLRFLAVTIDNGMMSPVVLDNIKIIVEKLKFDHILYKPNHDVFQRSFKYAIEQVKGRGCSQVVDRIDGDLLHDIGFHLAAKMEIPLVLSGLSKEQLDCFINIDNFILPKERLLNRRSQSGVLNLSNFAEESDFDNYWWSPHHYANLPTVIYPNTVWDFSTEEISNILQKTCGLPPEKTDPIFTNYQLIPIMGVIDFRQMGYSSFEPEFANMVRRGKADRAFWLHTFEFLEYLSKYTHFFDADIKAMFQRLGVIEKEVFYDK